MDKLKELMINEMQIKDKIILSVIIGFALSLNFVFYGMMHIFMSNFGQFMIPLSNVLTAAVITSLVVWLAVSGILAVLPGKIFMLASSLAAGLLIAGYLQGNFFNGIVDLGELTGDAIDWHEHTMYTLLNTVLWLLIIFVPAIVRYFASAGIWKRVILIACVLLTGMQAAALVTYYMSNSERLEYVPEKYLSREGAYEVSSKNNIMVFVIDRLDFSYVEEVRESDPAFFDRLDGFTEFTNAGSAHPSTFPSGVLMTTGIPYDYKQTRHEYFDYAWNNSEFIRTLKDAGYTMKYHMADWYMYSNIKQIENVADNISEGKFAPKMTSLIKNFALLSAYRFAPMALKPALWIPSVDIDMEGDIIERDYVAHNDPLFMELLEESGLTLQSERNNYFYLHLRGSHAPYIMDENGMNIGSSNRISQTKGCFNILFQYMDEMKKLGIYENSTIIICGDHGSRELGGYSIGFFMKPRGSANTPPVQNNAPVSVSENLLPTILESEGINSDGFGISVFDIEPDTRGERFAVRYGEGGQTVEYYKVTGDIRDYDNWELVESYEYSMDVEAGLPAGWRELDN